MVSKPKNKCHLLFDDPVLYYTLPPKTMKTTAVALSNSSPGQVHHYILDPDQPRPPSQFLDTGIDWAELGERVRRRVRGVTGISYQDEFADLAARIYRDGPTVIGGRGS